MASRSEQKVGFQRFTSCSNAAFCEGAARTKRRVKEMKETRGMVVPFRGVEL